MGTPPTPPNPVQPAVLDQQPPPVSTRSDAEMHFTNLLGYFKHLVWITTAAVTVILGAAVYFLASNLRDVRQDAREQATRVATEESKTAVRKTFDEKNINDLIHKAAIDKIGSVTDKLIEQQLTSKLRPVEQRILLIGRISECEAQMHTGLRVGLVELDRIISTTNDPVALEFAKSTFTSLGEQYDAALSTNLKDMGGIKAVDFMAARWKLNGSPVSANLHGAVQVINDSPDLNAVGFAFIAFRDLTGEHVRTFDVAAVKSWCAKHQTQCQ